MTLGDALDRAHAGYDPTHREALTEAILRAIADASIINEPRVLCLRTGELTDALVDVLAAAIAMSPEAIRSPAAIRKLTDELRRRSIKKVAEAGSNPDFQDFERRIFRNDDEKRGGRA
jgi:anaerobic glycerol-3-phosphate dehydrogenase